MDTRKLKKYINSSLGNEFNRLQIKSKSTTYFYTPINWLIKGISFDKSDNKLYVSWFIMPLIPESDSIILTYGDRIKNGRNLDFFELQDENGLPQELESSVKLKLNFLDSINDVCMFYKYFYTDNNLTNLSQTWVASSLRLLETEIYCKAYIGLNYDSELDLFLNKWNSSKTKHLDWMVEMKLRICLLDEAVKSGEVNSYLSSIKTKTIDNLNLGRFLEETL